MAQRKKAIHAKRKNAGKMIVPETVDVVDGVRHSNVSLAEILKRAEFDINFIPLVNSHLAGELMFLYDGREVYVKQKEETFDEELFYHGTLEIDVMNERTYEISYKDTRHRDKLYFSKVRRMIVVRR